jgi:hypothetical protein
VIVAGKTTDALSEICGIPAEKKDYEVCGDAACSNCGSNHVSK